MISKQESAAEHAIRTTLDREQESVVETLFDEYMERVCDGEQLEIKSYFKRCPDEEIWNRFRAMANMHQLIKATLVEAYGELEETHD